MKINDEKLLVIVAMVLGTMLVGLGTHDIYGNVWMAANNAGAFLASVVIVIAVYRRSSAIARLLENLNDDATMVHLIVTGLLVTVTAICCLYGSGGSAAKLFLPTVMTTVMTILRVEVRRLGVV